MQDKKFDWAIKPDAQPFDEIRIKIVPRFKESELSGDEWRISTVNEFYRNGVLIHTSGGAHTMEYAAGFLFMELARAGDDGHAYYAGDGVHCDQEGCSEHGKFVMKLKKRFCAGGGKCGQEKKHNGFINNDYRLFCERHRTRGDSDLEDNDKNYELVEVI